MLSYLANECNFLPGGGERKVPRTQYRGLGGGVFLPLFGYEEGASIILYGKRSEKIGFIFRGGCEKQQQLRREGKEEKPPRREEK